MWTRILKVLRSIARRREREGDLEKELQFHLEMETRANVERGMSPAAAREASLRRFGGVDQVKEEVRDSWGVRTLDTLAQDVRFAFRNLRKNPGFSVIVLLTLALGIGANTAMFSVINGVLLRSLPYGGGDRLVVLHQPSPGIKAEDVGFSVKEMADYRDQSRTLDAVVEYHSMPFNLYGRGEAQRVQTGVVSANFFDVLGVQPLHGRTFKAGEDADGAPPVLVLSYAYFKREFGGDPNVVGLTFEMNDKVHTVVGVLPPVPQYPNDNDIYMPSSACPFRSSKNAKENRQFRILQAVFGRLKPGATLEEARSEAALIAGRFAPTYPADYPAAEGLTAKVERLREELVHPARPTVLVLFGTTGFVLLLVCANVANLMLARTAGRERELSLRMALGAGRRRLVRQLLTESAVLSLLGGGLGLLFAAFVLDMLVAFVGRYTPRANEIAIDARVLLFALGASLLTGLLFGLVPALSSRPSIATSLNSGRAGTGARLSLGTRNALIVSQVAISFVLLTGAGLLMRSFMHLEQVDPGFKPENVLAVNVSMNWSKYTDDEKRLAFYRPLLQEISEMPGVASVAIGSAIPLNEGAAFTTGFEVQGHPQAPNAPRPQIDVQIVSPSYFRTMGVPLLRGRTITEQDRVDAPPVAVISESMARRHFGNDDPLGQKVKLQGFGKPGEEPWGTIIGVVGNVREAGLDKEASEELYLSLFQATRNTVRIFARTQRDPWALVAPIHEIFKRLDPRQPMGQARTLEQVRSDALAPKRVMTALIGIFAVLAMLITSAGIVGVVSYSVSQRTQEIGVRMALGADRRTVIGMVLRQGLRPVAFGLAVGVAGALALTKLIAGFLFGVGPTDPMTFAAVIVSLIGAAALACWQPARRAAGIEPMIALRAD